AAIIHFFGGIHEIYFPYVLMKPQLLLSVIAGGMSGVFTLVLLDGGLHSPASPGSIFAITAVTPTKLSLYTANYTAIAVATNVTFLVAMVILRRSKDISTGDLDEATAKMQAMKSNETANHEASSGQLTGDIDMI